MAHEAWTASRPRANDQELGLFCRMYAIQPHLLPAHPDLPSSDAARPELGTFLGDILKEAHTFATSVIPGKFKVKGTERDVSPSTAKVQILTHDVDITIPAQQGSSESHLTENWFARISKHENALKDGTATWQELDAGLRQDHAVHEMEYTPDLKDAHLVLDWRSELVGLQGNFGDWQDVHAEIREMVHELPTPLSKRCFSVLVISAKKGDEFIDAQLPVDLSTVSKAKYFGASGFTEGIYCSIEYGKLIDAGAKTEWRMATTSDAGGNLPMWAQKMGLPGAIAKDVGLFMDWRMKQRKQSS